MTACAADAVAGACPACAAPGRDLLACGGGLPRPVGGVVVALALLASAEVPVTWRPFGALTIGTVVSLGAGLVLTLRRQPPATLPRYGMADLMRSGRWLLAIEAITAGATFLASVIVSRLDDPAALGYAEAARIVGQPIFVLAVGLSAVLNPRAMEAGAGRDRAAARHVARPFTVLLAIVGLVYGVLTAVPWWGNPFAGLVPQAYVVAGLVPVTVASFVLFGLPIIPRSELTGARRERVLPRVGLIAGVLQCAAALSAVWIGSFARPLGVALLVPFSCSATGTISDLYTAPAIWDPPTRTNETPFGNHFLRRPVRGRGCGWPCGWPRHRAGRA
jgi:O-antigen/teichoic acid export membrane protein